MSEFDEILKRLNKEQLEAVETIDGPLLVLAGPGTGKTQLLSARVANILNQDNSPGNILCLTFTESGAKNMRERLGSMIGMEAYDVHISTYHSFGSDIIRTYGEYFEKFYMDRSEDTRMERPIDELSQIRILSDIIEKLPYDSPMLGARYYIKHLASTISELKRSLYTPESLSKLALSNIGQIDDMQPEIDRIVNEKGGISRKKAECFNQYAQLLEALTSREGDLINLASTELSEAIVIAERDSTTKPLTAWKNAWLHKNERDLFTFTERARSEKMHELGSVYKKYQLAMQSEGLYDFDDMIIKVIDAINENDELRFNLQEKYQYILLDEFQDTNAAQFELVRLIADHPVHEGRPNIMAVGDDDQAIYAFQGAEVGNMTKFIKEFRDVRVINLKRNYRSHKDIISVAHNISEQIENRLHTYLDGVGKTLEAANATLPSESSIERHEFKAQASEFDWVAEKIEGLIKNGCEPSEIVVLAPKHKLLEEMVPFLNKREVAVTYEKRENILEVPMVESLRLMSELVVALRNNRQQEADRLLAIVLSLDFFKVSVDEIWKINWKKNKREEKRTWAEIGLEESEVLKNPIRFFLGVASMDPLTPLEYILDIFSGVSPVKLSDTEEYSCPLKDYYFTDEKEKSNAIEYFESIGHLSVIRSKLREFQGGSERKLTLDDFLNFFLMYETAEQALVDSHPISQNEDSVQLMTAFKSKGLEFEHVFILSAHDNVWGSKAKSNSNKLSLPQNLSHIRYVGGDEDELKRLLFVAITRSKHGLYITSHLMNENGKTNESVKYLGESDGISHFLPEGKQEISRDETLKEQMAEQIDTLWQSRHIKYPSDLKSLLKERLEKYQMSPTHLNSYVDLMYSGPESFFFSVLLRFPQAPGVDGEYGTAVHNTLEWYQNRKNDGSEPSLADVLKQFEKQMSERYIAENEMAEVIRRGKEALTHYLGARVDMFSSPAKSEVNFFNEGVTVGSAHLSGKIDRLEIDEKAKVVRIADYKTGSGYKKWKNDIKLMKYKQQLYFYKLLIEHSNTYKGYRVESARLEFVEPDSATGEILEPLYIEFSEKEEAEIAKLIEAVWSKVINLDFVDVSEFDKTVYGSLKFIASLVD